MNFEPWFQSQSSQKGTISPRSLDAVLRLHQEGATVPFMARYRKEATGNLDEVAIQSILDGKETWDEILKRKTFILKEIGNQEKLTPELKAKIESTFDLNQLEDLYLPYKKKRKSKAQKAKDLGLEPLANSIWDWGRGVSTPEPGKDLMSYADKMKGKAKSQDEALEGAKNIIVERISEILELRQKVRERFSERGFLGSQKGKKAKEHSKFKDYFDYQEKIPSLFNAKNSHRFLALKRGEKEGELKISFDADQKELEGLLGLFQEKAAPKQFRPSLGHPILEEAAKEAYQNYVFPSISTEITQALKNLADETAIVVFAENVRKILLEAPFGSKTVLGIDPGIRTGCKVALIDESGKFLLHFVIRIQSEKEKQEAKEKIKKIIQEKDIKAIAVGNGTGGRETESFLKKALEGAGIPIVLVNESGASIYSASEIARKEFPSLDLTVRGAISIARRLQDPLAELVKIDPKSIGVGQYQHDVSQNALKKSLSQVVDSCVNSVGVNLNTASPYLLSHVSGIGPVLAKNILKHRHEKGLFKTRKDLLKVSRFSEKVFEQAAGFLRLPQSPNLLDSTGIHPERYGALENLAKEMGVSIKDFLGKGIEKLRSAKDFEKQMGKFTFKDILNELEKPGRDPRETFQAFQFREDIQTMDDLKKDMICPGVITNVTNFGAFVDIGVHQDALVHISELADRFVKDPKEVVSPGDRVKARVLEVDSQRKRISLSLKQEKESSFSSSTKRKKTHSSKKNSKSKNLSDSPFAALANFKKK